MTDNLLTLLHGEQLLSVKAGKDSNPLLNSEQIFKLCGWQLKDEGLCKEGQCIALGRYRCTDPESLFLTVTALAELLQLPMAVDVSQSVVCLGEPAAQRAEKLNSLQAPDFTLPNLQGEMHQLSHYRGKKVLLIAWASWCGCREDLPHWQALFEQLKNLGFVVITVALDSKTDDARPFIEAANPAHPSLIDHQHLLAELYGLINVPSVIWIDESGQIVRPARVEHASNQFQWVHGLDSEPHLAAVRRWAKTGEVDMSREQVIQGQMLPSHDEQLARAYFKLGFYCYQQGNNDVAKQHFEKACELSPDDWTIRRGSMWLRDMDPFGQDFFDVWSEWEKQGKPDYITKAKQQRQA